MDFSLGEPERIYNMLLRLLYRLAVSGLSMIFCDRRLNSKIDNNLSTHLSDVFAILI